MRARGTLLLSSCVPLGMIGYDYVTQHKMRKLYRSYNIRQGVTRFQNFTRTALPVWMLGRITLKELESCDGKHANPLWFSVGGRVYDATNSETFRKAYPQWAGRDATISLCSLSLSNNLVGSTDWDTLSNEDLKVLRDWIRYLDQNLPVVAELNEWIQMDYCKE